MKIANTAPFVAPQRFQDAQQAWQQVELIYTQGVGHLRDALQRFLRGEEVGRVRACYPFVRVHTETVVRADSRRGSATAVVQPCPSPEGGIGWRMTNTLAPGTAVRPGL